MCVLRFVTVQFLVNGRDRWLIVDESWCRRNVGFDIARYFQRNCSLSSLQIWWEDMS